MGDLVLSRLTFWTLCSAWKRPSTLRFRERTVPGRHFDERRVRRKRQSDRNGRGGIEEVGTPFADLSNFETNPLKSSATC